MLEIEKKTSSSADGLGAREKRCRVCDYGALNSGTCVKVKTKGEAGRNESEP